MLKECKVDIFLTFLAVFPVVFSLYYDFTYSNDYYWLQRSGSLMVLFGVMLDFYQNQFVKIESSSKVRFMGQAAITGSTLPPVRKQIQVFSIALAIVGTFIWGYGDIPFK
ncbi:hypothetical protein AB4259_22310 [Vibrio amylolyticus]|uniref:hypothetical protein n=1 Tax=Vibrio amylolyticus TaxID=2847292 RepID=UPI00354DA5FF